MSNDFFDDDDWDELARLTLARAESVNAIADAIVVGFDKLPGELPIKQGRVTFIGSDGGALNAYIITPTHLPAAYADGMEYTFRAATTNDGAATVDTYGVGSVLLGVKEIRTYAGAALSGGEIVENAFTTIRYDNSAGYWRITNPVVAIGSVETFNISALTAETTPDDADVIAIHDATANAKRKMTLQNALIVGWPVLSEVDPTADYVMVYDASGNAISKVLTGAIADEYSIILKSQLFAGA